MYIFIIASATIAILTAFFPELFPSCSCCRKIKPRPFFKIHRAIGISPGYRGSKSVCTKCCRKYDISTISDLDKVTDIKRKLRLQALAKNDL